MTKRGEFLRKGHINSQYSNIFRGEKINIKNRMYTIGDRCPVCRKRIRGLNHVAGSHHQAAMP